LPAFAVPVIDSDKHILIVGLVEEELGVSLLVRRGGNRLGH
jgi:hypothetical protein